MTLRCIFFFLCLSCFHLNVTAQSLFTRWQYGWSGIHADDVVTMVPLPGNQFLFGGSSWSDPGCTKTSTCYGNEDFAIFVLDDNGNKLWEKSYGGQQADELHDMAQVPAGGFVLVGETGSGSGGNKTSINYGSGDAWIIRVDVNGNILWERTFGTLEYESADKVIATADGGFLIGGRSHGDRFGVNYGRGDYYALKLDGNGNYLWSKTYGGADFEQFKDIIPMGDGNFLLAGDSRSPAGGSRTAPTLGGVDQWVVCISPDGTPLWDKAYGSAIPDYWGSLLALADGNFLITGFQPDNGGGLFPSGGTGVLRKIDKLGNLIWTRNCTGMGILTYATQGPSGIIFVGGESSGGVQSCKTSPLIGGSSDIWLTTYDNNGNKIGDMDFGGNSGDFIQDIKAINDDVWITGWSQSGLNGNKTTTQCVGADGWIIRLTNSLYVHAPTPTEICSNATNLNVSFTANNIYQPGNIFTAQLSDKNGNFLNPTNIGQLAGTTSGIIPSVLPPGLPASDHYKIRVVASNPAENSAGYEISIHGPPQVNLGIDTTICINKPVALNAGIQPPGTQYLWNDGSTGNSVTVSTAGIWTCEVTNSCGTITDNIIITTKSPPVADIGDNTSFCEGTGITLQSSAQPADVTYLWNTGVMDSFISVNTGGSYWLHTTNSCGTTGDTILVVMNPKPQSKLNKNPVICNGTSRLLDAGQGFDDYLWYDGQGGNTRTINGIGSYWVRIRDNNGCETYDTTTITRIVTLPTTLLVRDTSLCSFEDITLKTGNNYRDYEWSTGERSSSITVSDPADYWLRVTDQYGCTGIDTIMVSRKECPVGFYMPNAFTPNNDGKNDFCRPAVFGKVKSYHFTIYNRWGEKVFESHDRTKGWNGYYGSITADIGAYVWTCSYQLEGETEQLAKGTVMLIR